jgi:hypothetical protein
MSRRGLSALFCALGILAVTVAAQSQFPTIGMPDQPVVFSAHSSLPFCRIPTRDGSAGAHSERGGAFMMPQGVGDVKIMQ